MNETAVQPATQAIVIDEVFPHDAATTWRALTTGDLIARWLMPAEGFEAVVGNRFTYKTTPAGAWDGTIRCEILEVVPNERLAYSWKGGDDANVGYGSKLDTVVAWTLSPVAGGTRVRVIHSGFVLPRNETAYRNMSDGWKKVTRRLDATAAELGPSGKPH
ncbi:SRPBCC domain-containing protein [Mesorhizobium sp. ZMM04-5]|uniref:SRPBCC domain-containing protein n=1 Tax=Mesorhizobium marinum TaxID=3228790 RepID=A0ABV3R066_9HYPH